MTPAFCQVIIERSLLSPKLVLLLIFAAFLALRLPVMLHQPGGQDEDCYAVPGLTILQDGIPRLPHVPARNPESVFYRADQAIYSEPPLYFYYQSLFYAVLPHSYGTARLSAATAGLLAAAVVYGLYRRSGGVPLGGWWAAGLFVFSRWFYFPATSARPDILCALFGLLAIAAMFRWQVTQRRSWLWWAGASIGAGGLTHPFALVYAFQLAVWGAWASRRWQRVANPLILAIAAIAVACLWLPLIAVYPEAFEIQFRNQFLSGHEESLVFRIFMPWHSLWYHWFGPAGMVGHIGLWQTTLVFVPTIYCALGKSPHGSSFRVAAWLALSSIYILCVLVGSHHPVMGYWSYTAALMFLCVGKLIEDVTHAWERKSISPTWKRVVPAAVAVALMLSMVPGSGLTTLYVHLKHWRNENYDSPRFAAHLAKRIPEQAVVAVDTQFLVDFVAMDRKALLAQTSPMYFRLDQVPFDYLIVSRYGIDSGIVDRLSVEKVSTHGILDDKFACYAEIYRAVPSPAPSE